MDSLASRNSCRSSAFSAAWSDGVLWLLRAAMCVRELNFRLLLRGLRADSMFAHRSKSSRVSVPLMRMLYPMGHYGSTGFVRSVSLAFVKKGGLGWKGLLPFGEYVASSGLTYVSKPAFLKTLVYFQRAHPPFVFYFTATFISFSCCLIRARSPV